MVRGLRWVNPTKGKHTQPAHHVKDHDRKKSESHEHKGYFRKARRTDAQIKAGKERAAKARAAKKAKNP